MKPLIKETQSKWNDASRRCENTGKPIQKMMTPEKGLNSENGSH
jgi:hypothetical protein